jgi:glutamate dehydrogenase
MAPRRKVKLDAALEAESKKFQACYLWMEKNLPEAFFDQVDDEILILVVHSLMDFAAQDFSVTVHLKNQKVVLCTECNAKMLEGEVCSAAVFEAKELFEEKAVQVAVLELGQKEATLPALEEDEYQIKIEKGQAVLSWRRLFEPGFVQLVAKTASRIGAKWQKIEIGQAKEGFVTTIVGARVEEVADEVVLASLFPGQEEIEKGFAQVGTFGVSLFKTMAFFIHQVLVYTDANLYSFEHIEEGLCRHPEVAQLLLKAFEAKFHPTRRDRKIYDLTKLEFLEQVDKIDTGQEANDLRRKTILKQGLKLVEFTLKTNAYFPKKTGFSFRLDPKYLEGEKFPELPYAVFFIKGLHFMGFHVRFRDLARGGLRTVFPQKQDRYEFERNQIFSECYNLAYTQQKKNKDIPEGGAKGVILLEPCSGIDFMYQAQRNYVECLLDIVNDPEPEYIYLGPDENMQNPMIVWICNFATKQKYKPGHAFMSSKPGAGINHKEFGVTSRGVNIYMDEVLKVLGIDPQKETFTVKMTGGPDGDVAGNQMHNLYRFYPKTAKLVATIDVSGTIFDPKGLDLKLVDTLFTEGKPIGFYPSDNLNDGGFILDSKNRLLVTRTKKKEISESEMFHLLRTHVHAVKADVFIPAGGRPRTLSESNLHDFLDKEGKPTSKAVVEGGNLYLTPGARRELEKRGCLVIKDSSANKGGVICSSFEVLSSLVLTEKEFISVKPELVQEIIAIIESRCLDEAKLLLSSPKGVFLTDVSDAISEKINAYTDELFAHLVPQTLSSSPQDPLIRALLSYCPPLLRTRYPERILKEVPDIHKKAIIACFLAQRLVYRRGLAWSPSIVDVLPLILSDPKIFGD